MMRACRVPWSVRAAAGVQMPAITCLMIAAVLLAPSTRAESRGIERTPVRSSPRSGPPRPVPPSRDVLYSQPADLNDGKITSEIISQYGLETEVADDFVLTRSAVVTNVVSWGGYYNWEPGDPPITGLNIRFFDSNGHVPGIVIDEYLGTPLDDEFVGYDGFGYPTYRYETAVAFPARAVVHYWLVVQACDHTFPPQWGRQLHGAHIHWDAGVFRSEFFSYPNWTGICSDLMYDCDSSFELQGVGGTGDACCFADATCILLDPDDCVRYGGYPQGEGVPCDPNPCSVTAAACCLVDGSCRFVPPDTCHDMGGLAQGAGSDCSPNPCPDQPQACCFDDGSCEVLQPDPCIEQGGSPGGPGEDCDPNHCDEAHACCFELGSCRMLVPDACLDAGGVSLGAGTRCTPNPCAPHSQERACCLDDNRCVIASVIDCVTQGGDPSIPGTTCDPDPCTPAAIPRACCFADGVCVILLADPCTEQGGVPQGACTVCDPNPCAGVSIERASWGRIKALFHPPEVGAAQRDEGRRAQP